MRDEKQFIIDLGILIVIAIAIYYFKMQTTGEVISPFDGVMAVLGLN